MINFIVYYGGRHTFYSSNITCIILSPPAVPSKTYNKIIKYNNLMTIITTRQTGGLHKG